MKEKKIRIDNLEVNYKEEGEGNSLLILHGWGGSSDSWKDVQDFLSRRGYRVIVPNLPGFGKSHTPPEPWSIEDYIEFLRKFTEELELKQFFLIGHSFGGSLAVKLSSEHRESVRKLALCDSAGIRPRPGLKEKLIYFVTRIGRLVLRRKFLIKSQTQAENLFYALLRHKDYSKANRTMKETMQKVLSYYDFPDERDTFYQDLSKVKTQTLIVWGKEDKMLPVNFSLIFKEEIKNSKRVILSETGHSPNLDTPERLSKILLKFFRS